MAELLADCPRCRSEKMTFDVQSVHIFKHVSGWQNHYEAACVCRHCNRTTIFVLIDNIETYVFAQRHGLLKVVGTLNKYIDIDSYISIKDRSNIEPPEHLPLNIKKVFDEASTCISVKCFNAAGTMFRLALDMATASLLPLEDQLGLTSKIRRDLGLRLPWLFENNLLPKELKDLSTCVKDDGNDGAHRGTLEKEDAEDLLDFTYELLERMFTEPARLQIAKERRESRRKN